MGQLTALYDNLKEKLKQALEAQQESEWFARLKEKYDNASTLQQKLIRVGGVILAAVIILWIPVTSLIDASDLNSQFEERRQELKELLKIEREYTSVPSISIAPNPFFLKPQFDQKLTAMGVKPEQIKEAMQVKGQGTAHAEQQGMIYTLTHVTVKQAVDIGYELEQVDKSLKLSDFQIDAEPQDPHFYTLHLKIVNYTPKAVANAK